MSPKSTPPNRPAWAPPAAERRLAAPPKPANGAARVVLLALLGIGEVS